jgi:hypothetical protein
MYDVGVRPSYDRSYLRYSHLRLPRQLSDAVEHFHDADGCKGTKESTAAGGLDYKTTILAAQILVERPEDRNTTTSPPPATLSAKHDQPESSLSKDLRSKSACD